MNNMFIKSIAVFLVCFLVVNKSEAKDEEAFLKPPLLIKNPSSLQQYSKEARKFSGIPSIAVSQGGRIWAIWYTGITEGEDSNNYVTVSTSGDGGITWNEILAIDPDGDGPVRAFDPEAWIDPAGKLWLFWAQAVDHDGTNAGVWSINTATSNIENPVWSEPRRLTNGVMMCKPMVLSDGTWVLPASTWRLTDNSAKVIMSNDKGFTWYEQGAVNIPKEVREFDEHMVIEKKNGSLWMLVRTKYGIGESISTDKGKSWSPLVPSIFQHPNARFFIHRLISGNLILVKHGPIGMKTGRSHLMAFISKDDGNSWSKGLLLDERKGVSYPDGQQIEDESVCIIYDYNRTKEQMILMTSLTEDDILGNDYDSRIVEVNKRRKIISEGGRKENPD